MNGISSMHKDGGRAGGIEGGYNFIRDDGTFANAGNDYSTFWLEYFPDTGFEIVVDKIGKIFNRPGFIY